MAHLRLLHPQILLEAVLRRYLGGDALSHAHAGRFQSRDLFGIIRDEPHRIDTHCAQDARRQLECPAIGVEAQLQVCFHRIQSLVLQLVGAQFPHQPNAPPLLLLVDQDARAGLDNLAQSQLQLQPAVAAQRVKDVAGEALRMDAHQWRSRVDVAHHQGDGFLALGYGTAAIPPSLGRTRALKAENAEMSPARWEIRVSNPAHRSDGHTLIIKSAARAHSAPVCLLPATGSPLYAVFVLEPRIIFITLLIKLGVAAAVAAALARSRTFQRLLLRDARSIGQTLGLLAFICIPLGLGVYFRVTVSNFLGADISFETTVLLGILVGPASALLGAVMLALPAVLHGEYLALPFLLTVAVVASIYGMFVEKEEVWSFSPFVDLSLWRWVRRNLLRPRVDRQILLLFLIVALEILREWIHRLSPHRLFAVTSASLGWRLAIWAVAPMVVGIPLKIWNSVRIEQSLEEQKRLLLEARLDALQRQINPHFLFNTLNSIASLVRRRPEQARELIVKLANILRRILSEHDALVPFRDELATTEDYLSIEVARFGAEKLRVVKEVEPATLDVPVPTMLMQPLVENSIKHGLEPRIAGGVITLRSRLDNGRLVIEVEDDGVGIAPGRPRTIGVLQGTGIGMRNVRERLQVLYGDGARFNVESQPGRGTRVTMAFPAQAPDPEHLATRAAAADLRR
jgi:two-component system, LytTR family, sensor kinase